MNTTAMTRLQESAVESVLASGDALIYKHSPTCWISAMTVGRVDEMARENPALAVYVVDVISQRALSNALAAKLGVPHASPQVILVRDGEAIWDASHLGISPKKLTEALAR